MNEEQQVQVIHGLMHKAERSLKAAGRLHQEGDSDFAISRAYYAMFYCAQALLWTKGLSFSKHAGVIAAFGKEFAKPGLVPERLHRSLLKAFKERQRGDYENLSFPTKRESQEIINLAEEFISGTKRYVKTKFSIDHEDTKAPGNSAP